MNQDLTMDVLATDNTNQKYEPDIVSDERKPKNETSKPQENEDVNDDYKRNGN